jgi:hypothetical protein
MPTGSAALCFSRILLVFVLVLVIGLFARVFDYDYEDEDDDDSKTAPSTRPGTLVALAKSSVMQPWALSATINQILHPAIFLVITIQLWL